MIRQYKATMNLRTAFTNSRKRKLCTEQETLHRALSTQSSNDNQLTQLREEPVGKHVRAMIRQYKATMNLRTAFTNSRKRKLCTEQETLHRALSTQSSNDNQLAQLNSTHAIDHPVRLIVSTAGQLASEVK